MLAQIIRSFSQPEILIPVLAAISVFATVMTVAQPYFSRDRLGTRIKAVALEREKIRARERARLARLALAPQAGGRGRRARRRDLNAKALLLSAAPFMIIPRG